MFIDQKRILDETDGGLKIILHYFPQAEKGLVRKGTKFKLRDNEKTASATLKLLSDGTYVVTDFGGDQKPKNGIHICMEEESLDFKEALQLLAERYGITEGGGTLEILKPEISVRDAKAEENDGEWYFDIREAFTDLDINTVLADKAIPYITNKDSGTKTIDFEKVEKVFKRYHFYSLVSYSVVKNRKVTTIASTDRYPIFMWDEGDFKKIYQPLSPDKSRRFMYYGKRRADFLHGLSVCALAYDELNQGEEEIDEDTGEVVRKKDKKLPEIIYCAGGSDGMNLAMIGYQVVWGNSETAKLTEKQFKQLTKLADKVMNMPDIDSTGKQEAHRLGMEHLELHTIVLPEELKKRPDKRGNPSKDVRDYLKHFNHYDFKHLVRTALPYRFWDEVWFKNKADKWEGKFDVKNTRLYNFLTKNGFYRLQSNNDKTGFIYIKITDNIVKEIDANEVKAYVHKFLEERYMDENLRDVFFKSNQLKESSLSNLPETDIDFTDFDKNTQFFFFQNRTVEVCAKEIKVHKPGQIDRYVWEDEVIQHKFTKQEPQFRIFKDANGNFDIEVIKKDNIFFNFLINASRVHWRKELEEALQGKKALEIKAYTEANRFNIAGPNLAPEEIHEQKMHLINKIYVLGYLLHRYKDPSRPWAVWTMDSRISDEGESHGGSGKSICMGSISHFMKSVTLKGRDQKLTENPHMYDRVTIHTDYILVDDANQYLKFDAFFSDITGNMNINPKNNKSYEIPFTHSPKFAFSSNFPLRNIDSSVARRILYCVFSDYYHENKDDYFRESRSPRDEFGINILGPDYSEKEWNDFYNFMIQCCQFYMNHGKIDPPMDNVEKRNLLGEMGTAFHEWADTYFSEESGNLNSFVPKKYALDDFMKTTKSGWTSQKFTKALRAWVRYYGFELDPVEYQNAQKRIVRKMATDGGVQKAMEMIYINTFGPGASPAIKEEEKVPSQNEDLDPDEDLTAGF